MLRFLAACLVLISAYALAHAQTFYSTLSPPAWVLPGAMIDLNFANGSYWANGRDTAPAALLTFSRNTAMTCTTRGGVLFYAAVNVPCITDLGFHIWHSAVNLLLQSQFAATWTATRSSLDTAHAVAAPDLSTTAVPLIEDSTATNTHLTVQSVTKAASAIAYTYSVYAKANTRTRIMLQLDDNAGNGATAGFDLAGGQIAYAAAGLGTPYTSLSAVITPLGSTGWYRCELLATSNTATTIRANVFLDNGSGTAAQSTTYSGDGTSNATIWGAQLEATAFSTPYIPTTTGSGTRNTDIGTITLTPYTTTLISQGGAWLFQGNQTSTAVTFRAMMTLDDGSSTNYLSMVQTSSTTIRFDVLSSSVNNPLIATAVTRTTPFRYALSWTPTSVAGSVNGAAALTASGLTLPAITGTTWRLGADAGAADFWNGYMARAVLFNTPLQAATLRALTSSF